MTKKRSTRSALLGSVLALVLCFTMLLGSTFAWFTDSASTGSNVIKSGNLDIKVEYSLDGKSWKDLDGAKDLFQKGPWEPGHTEVVLLKITNNGSLALKYTANMNIVNETVGKTVDGKDIVLSEILTVSTCTQQYTDGNGNVASGADIFPAMTFNGADGADGWIGYQTTATFKAGNVLKNDKQLSPKEADYIAVRVDMPETVGNEANHDGVNVPSIEFGLNVLATQYTEEEDSFGNSYDADAEYLPMVTTLADLRTAMEKGGEYKLGADINVAPSELLYKADGGHSDGSAFLIKADMVLDLNGYDIVVDAPGLAADVFFVNGGHEFTVKGDGNVTADCGIFVAYDAATTINIEGGNYKCTVSNDMLYAIWGKLNVSGGTYETAYWNLINIYGQGNISLVDVSGGSFKNWSPASSPDGNLLADGYKVVSEVVDGVTWYNVVPE